MFEIIWADEARDELERVPIFRRAAIVAAVGALRLLADQPTKNRKPLEKPLAALPDATWEVRIDDWRVLYRIVDARTVRLLRVIFKGRAPTDVAIRRSKKP